MEVTAIGEDERARFDEAVAASPLADVMQSWGWGAVKATTGWRPVRLLVTDGPDVRAACQILRRVPARGVPPLLYAPRGPVLDYDDPEPLRVLLAEIRRRAGSAFLFKCDPPVAAGSAAARALAGAGLRTVRAGAFGGTQPTAVMVLDLTPGPEQIFEGFHRKWRYNVRLAGRKGVKVREGGLEDLEAFHALYRTTAARDGFTGRGISYFRSLFEHLAPDHLRLFLAEHEGELLSGIVVMPMGERAIYVYGASSDHKRNLMPNHAIQWHAITWACEQGYRIYDFRGVSPVRDGEPVEEHLAGLNRFKEGFGTRYVEYAGEFDLPLRRGWYGLWRTAAPAAMRARAKLRGGGGEDA